MKNSRAVVFHEHGAPATVIRIEEVENPEPGPHDVVVEVQAAPINPVDLNVIEGKYPVRPPLPAIAGTEGVGVVRAVGESASGAIQPGMQVILPQSFGSWREAAVIPAELLIPVPAAISFEQAAMLRINPPTAWRMLLDFVALQPGDWVAQNAAN